MEVPQSVGDESLRFLADVTSVESLRVEFDPIAEYEKPFDPEMFYIGRKRYMHGIGIKYLRGMQNLRYLGLDSSYVNGSCVEPILQLKNLKILSLHRTELKYNDLKKTCNVTVH